MRKTASRKSGDGSLITRGKSKYYYLQHRIDGKLTQARLLADGKPITDRRKAEKAAKEYLAPLREPTKAKQIKALKAKLEDEETKRAAIIAAARPSIALSKIWSEYEKATNRKKCSEKTLARYRTYILAFEGWLRETFPDVKTMRDVTALHAETYAVHFKASRPSPSTYNIHLNTLSVVWGVLAKKANISENPFAWDKKTRTGIPRENIKAEKNIRKKRGLTLSEINAVVEKASGNYHSLIVILACTGQRLVDCVKLEWTAVDIKQGIIRLTPRKTANRTGKEVLIPLLPQLREELDRLPRYGRHILPELVEVYDRDPSAITKQLRKIFEAVGIRVHKTGPNGKTVVEVGAHSFRYTFVTIARLAGIPDVIIQTITGHESIEMVDDYTVITPDVVKKLSASFRDTQAIGIGNPTPPREPVPQWARDILEQMTPQNCEQVKAEILKG